MTWRSYFVAFAAPRLWLVPIYACLALPINIDYYKTSLKLREAVLNNFSITIIKVIIKKQTLMAIGTLFILECVCLKLRLKFYT